MSDQDVVGVLSSLIELPSPNPPGDTRTIAAYCEEWLAAHTGASVMRIAPPEKPEAESIIASIGTSEGPTIMLHAHIDTVPVGEAEAAAWTSPPFKADIRDGKVYGKGAVDDKGILASMMVAMRELARGDALRGSIVLVGAAEEEVGGVLGTKWLVEQGLLPACDFIVVGEQTSNLPAAAHKGVLRSSVTVHGVSTHATNPDRGVSAIAAMSKIVQRLTEYHHELSELEHPLVGRPTCNVGTIVGGSTTNAVADSCTITIDRRVIPRETFDGVAQELERVVRDVDIAPATVTVHDYQYSNWFESDLSHGLGAAFCDTVSAYLEREQPPVGYLPGSDAKHLVDIATGGVVVFGAGTYEAAHAADEYVGVRDLEGSCEILIRFLRSALEGEA